MPMKQQHYRHRVTLEGTSSSLRPQKRALSSRNGEWNQYGNCNLDYMVGVISCKTSIVGYVIAQPAQIHQIHYMSYRYPILRTRWTENTCASHRLWWIWISWDCHFRCSIYLFRYGTRSVFFYLCLDDNMGSIHQGPSHVMGLWDIYIYIYTYTYTYIYNYIYIYICRHILWYILIPYWLQMFLCPNMSYVWPTLLVVQTLIISFLFIMFKSPSRTYGIYPFQAGKPIHENR